jgi:hypothetical protein
MFLFPLRFSVCKISCSLQMGSAETRRRTAGEPDVDLNQLIEVNRSVNLSGYPWG